MIKTGKIADINKNNKGWFLGDFMDSPLLNTKNSENFEVKWSHHEAGDFHPPKKEVVRNDSCISMAVLIYGSCTYSFLQKDGTYKPYKIENEGEFIQWKPDMNHQVEVNEETLLITIRWYEKD